MMDYDIVSDRWNAGVFRLSSSYCNILANKAICTYCCVRMYDHADASIS